jgi:hypothetical protein
MKVKSKIVLVAIILSAICYNSYGNPVCPVIADTDSTIFRELEEIDVYPRKGFRMNPKQYGRLVKKIKKVYPFAKEAAYEVDKYNQKYKGLKSREKKRQYIKKVEKELFKKHEKEFRKLTISEGRYLMLLIDREVGETSYELIDELKGDFAAHFWQGVAKIFGNDLKERYDPVYKHYLIEQIVLQLEREKS